MAVFFCKVEFFKGVLFLIIILFNDFDAAILKRIHLKLKYDDLNKSVREALITRFLKSIYKDIESSNISTEYFDCFARVRLNGRQVSCPYERERL